MIWITTKLSAIESICNNTWHGEHLREVNSALGDQPINDKVKQWDEDKNQKGIQYLKHHGNKD